LEAFLRTEPREAPSASCKEVLDDIKEDVIENLDLIGLLAEQIAELDNQAYQVFSKQKEVKRKKSSNFKKKPRRKESRRESYEEEEYEDEAEAERETVNQRTQSNGRIRNIGLRIRQ
jgi:hypothetical protein